MKNQGIKHALVNTTVSGVFIKYLAEQDIKCVSLIHEVPGIIQSYGLKKHIKEIVKHAEKTVFPASIVADGFEAFPSMNEGQKILRPQGLWCRNLNRYNRNNIRYNVRKKLGVSEHTPFILSVGFGDNRKGADLFAKIALETLKINPKVLFVWIGHWDKNKRSEVDMLIEGFEDSFRFLGYEPNTSDYHIAADIYALTSREDPFPNVVLESFDAGVPVITFEGTGGAADLISSFCDLAVPNFDVITFSKIIIDLLNNPKNTKKLSQKVSKLVNDKYSLRSYIFDLYRYLGIECPRVSVIVPNYNYSHLIKLRLNSIIEQTIPIYELIILDDFSTDESVKKIREWISDNNIECHLIINDKNSDSVFNQWSKGVSLASGDIIWIAEADDIAVPKFLETTLAPMIENPKVSLSYCDSIQIDHAGNVIAKNYSDYTKDLCPNHWLRSYSIAGHDEIVKYLAVQNTIPNVSAVVFNKNILQEVLESELDEIAKFRRAGDWLTYINILAKGGNIAFNSKALNMHRRHKMSVIGSSDSSKLINEIQRVQKIIATQFQLTDEIKLKANEHIIKLKKQFKLIS